MLADDEDVRYVLGECFVHMGTDDAQERLGSGMPAYMHV